MSLFSIHENIAEASTLPSAFYRDDHYFEMAREKIFAKTWHFVGDTDQIREPGWMTPVELLPTYLQEPLVLTRDQNSAINCLSNVCTHRGNILVEKPCKASDIRCKYHGRRFGLSGQFSSMPEFKEVVGFPAASDNLHSLPVFTLGKWLFTTLGSGTPEPFFKELVDRVGWMPFNQFTYRPELSRDYEVNANWALYCENYLEGFHIPFVHAGLNSIIDYGNYTTELYRYSNLQLGLARNEDSCFDLPQTSPDFGKKVAGYYFWVFPNMMFNFYPWGLSINIVQPVTKSKTVVSFKSYVWDESKLRQGAGANLHQVEMEDEDVVQLVQKGIRSRFYDRGRYSVKMETGTHHFHRLIDEFMSA